MVPFVPGVQQVREERSTVNYPFRNRAKPKFNSELDCIIPQLALVASHHRTSIRHEIVGESFQVAGVVMEFQQPVVVIIRDDDVFGVASHVNDLM